MNGHPWNLEHGAGASKSYRTNLIVVRIHSM